jgi:hypothetical protein
MYKNLKRTLVIPVLFVMTPVVWVMWFVIDGAEWVMKCIECIGDKLFAWAQK